MRRIKLWAVAVVTVLALLGGAWGVTAARTAPALVDPDEIAFTGTVVSIDAAAGTLVVEVATTDGGTETYAVAVPAGFDLDALTVGDVVEVEGVLDDGVVAATKVKVEDDGDDDDDDGDDDGDGVNAFCADPELTHPVGERLAERYGVTYEQVMGWFCDDGMGFGQIFLALQTAALTGDAPETYLDRRAAGEGWGQIWQDVGKVGPARKAADGAGEPGSPPAWAGPPDERDPDADKPGGGPPAWAGPQDGRDPDADKPGKGPKVPKP